METDLILCRILFIKWNKNYTFMSHFSQDIICQKLKFNVSRTQNVQPHTTGEILFSVEHQKQLLASKSL